MPTLCLQCSLLLAEGTMENLAECACISNEPLRLLASHLPFGAESGVVVALLCRHRFDVAAAESELFELLERRAATCGDRACSDVQWQAVAGSG